MTCCLHVQNPTAERAALCQGVCNSEGSNLTTLEIHTPE